MEFAREENGFAASQTRIRRLQFGCLLAMLLIEMAFFLLEKAPIIFNHPPMVQYLKNLQPRGLA